MLSRRKKRKAMVLRPINIFKGKSIDDFEFTDHFFVRWNERVDSPEMACKKSLKDYIIENYNYTEVEHLFQDIYLVGGLYITAKIDNGKVLFINTLGTYKNNPVLYNIITSGDYYKMMGVYGKVNLSYAE